MMRLPPRITEKEYAHRLTNEELAQTLKDLEHSPGSYYRIKRDAILHEAATRLYNCNCPRK